MASIDGDIADTLEADDTLAGSALREVALAQSFRVNHVSRVIRRTIFTLAETAGFAPANGFAYHPGGIVSESLRLAGAVEGLGILNLGVLETLRLAQTLTVGFPIAVSEGVGIAPAISIIRAMAIAERLGISDGMTGQGIYNLALAQGLRINAGLYRFLGADISESFGVAEALTILALRNASASEGLGVAATLDRMMLARIDVDETLGLTDDQVLHGIFQGEVVEGVQFSIGHIEPNGGFTSWAVNATTTAVTEYTNYTFNSFAKLGNHYFGTNDDGLYELDGDDDAGADIISDMIGGYLQLGGAHLTSFKGAYVATRGGGEYVLKLISADGKEYVYRVLSNSMQTSKVNIGKGLRSRYFAFQFVSTGQDFDLESLEFVPIIVKRRY